MLNKSLIKLIALITIIAFTASNCGISYAADSSKIRQMQSKETLAQAIGNETAQEFIQKLKALAKTQNIDGEVCEDLYYLYETRGFDIRVFLGGNDTNAKAVWFDDDKKPLFEIRPYQGNVIEGIGLPLPAQAAPLPLTKW